ncbi:MAG: hypothetical protein PHT69_02490 [Bacteroidales bacterium]|nr:hypothetical protein [Bacteroidales bacterium]
MYGKRRITITNDKVIVLAGNKSWIPIGRYHIIKGKLVGKLRNVGSYETSLNEKNSVDFEFTDLTQLRKFVKKQYAKEL